MAWTDEGNTHGEKREKGTPVSKPWRHVPGVVFLSFLGERLLEPAQNALSEEAPGLVDTL